MIISRELEQVRIPTRRFQTKGFGHARLGIRTALELVSAMRTEGSSGTVVLLQNRA